MLQRLFDIAFLPADLSDTSDLARFPHKGLRFRITGGDSANQRERLSMAGKSTIKPRVVSVDVEPCSAQSLHVISSTALLPPGIVRQLSSKQGKPLIDQAHIPPHLTFFPGQTLHPV